VTIIFRSLSLARIKQEAEDKAQKHSLGQSNSGGEGGGSMALAGADDFLPLFIYVVLQSQIPNLYANCEYIQLYHNPARMMSKSGYCLINLRSAIEFINYLEASSINIDPNEFQQKLEENEEKFAKGEL
jgi:hypothetical protein